MERIVVTGMGLVSPLGVGVETAWNRLVAGGSGLRVLPENVVGDLAAKVGGVVPSIEEDNEAGFDPDRAVPPKDQKKMDRFIQFAMMATDEAVRQAGWMPESVDARERTATIIASGVGGFPAITDAVRTAETRGVRRLSPFTVPSFLVNLAAGHDHGGGLPLPA